MRVHDAALRQNGRLLVALGEIGVRLLTRDGRTVTHFDQPADRLAISDHGDRAIALARRGEVWRLSRLNLVEWRAEDWCDAQIDAFAPTYDGSLWFLGAKGDFYAIDANSKSFEALWRVPDAGSKVVNVACNEAACSFVTITSDCTDVEKWVYRLPLLNLRSRTTRRKPPDNVIRRISVCETSSPEGIYVDQSLYCIVDSSQPEPVMKPLASLSLRVFENELEKFELVIGDESCRPLIPQVFGSRVVSPVLEKEGVRVRVIDLQKQDVAAELWFEGTNEVSTRLTQETLTVGDNLGRVLVVDLRRNCSIRNFRI
jgi:hypothetical protein